MKDRLKSIGKRVLAGLLCMASVITVASSAIPVAEAKASKDILGTDAALGSPIINTKNFSTEEWNKWETICWGVFLSNFVQPLVDTYETAFIENKGGSNGYGFNALWGGSGSDAANADTIKALCNYAIDKQSEEAEQIYVCFSDITNKEFQGKTEPDESNTRKATFMDLMFLLKDTCPFENCALADDENHIHTYIKHVAVDALGGNGEATGILNEMNSFTFNTGGMTPEYADVAAVSSAKLPTFYVKRDSGFVEVLDYTDWWDCQIVNAMVSAVRTNEQLTAEFEANFDVFFNSAVPLTLDFFGNITTGTTNKNYMVIPAALNQHITADKSINLLNSWVMNKYVQTFDRDRIALGLRQDLQRTNIEGFRDNPNGYAAFQDSYVGQIGMLYYDMDSIMVSEHENIKNERFTFGDGVNTLFSLDINSDKTSTFYPLKFEVSGVPQEKLSWWNLFGSNQSSMETVNNANLFRNLSFAAAMLPNVLFQPGANTKELLTEVLRPNGDKIQLFNDKGICIDVKLLLSRKKEEPTNQGSVRLFWTYLYECARSTTDTNGVSNRTIFTFFDGASLNDMKDNGSLSKLWSSFKKVNDKYKNIQDPTSGWNVFWDYGKNETVNESGIRLVIAYPPSQTMVDAAKILGIQDGAEFDTYCTYIYMTYLDFYGISTNDSLEEGASHASKFNTEIFSEERQNNLIVSIGDALAEYGQDFGEQVDIHDEVAHLSLLMLHPERGREYRTEMVESAMADWVYQQYNKTVYGGSNRVTGAASKARSGFLAIETYADNWFTGWFLANYVDIVIWVIMGSILIVIIVGLFKGKKISWFLLSVVMVINIFLIVPSTGEIVPYITSSMTQKMFAEKMTYWSISQGITNSTIEADTVRQSSYVESLDEDEASVLVSLIKDLSSLSTDSSLSVKQDISQKITQRLSNGVYSNIESYPSARWILPMIMQQFSAETEEQQGDFIYKPLAYVWDDMMNMYWYFNPADAQFIEVNSPTLTSGQTVEEVTYSPRTNEHEAGEYPTGQFEIYAALNSGAGQYNKDYVNVEDSVAQGAASEYHYKCIAYDRGDPGEFVHNICYYLTPDRTPISRKDVFGADASGYKDADSWQLYIDSAKQMLMSTAGNWKTDRPGYDGAQPGFDYTADGYDRTDRSSISPDMPYLWSTESPIYYFYCVIKDSFESSSTLGTVVYDLQGTTSRDESNNILRNNFMYGVIETNEGEITNRIYPSTGKIRDILDFEEMFSNMIPYMYEMSIIANGFDGESGILTDAAGEPYTISKEMQYYSGENQSWMYRCNWATKLMENPNFSEACTVRGADGTKYTITNPMLPESYPAERPMVFSEAQKDAMGLKDIDLNLVELKCIKVGKEVAKQWTLLLNYAGTPGITKEILYHQMATDATMIFCQEFSSSGLLDTTYELYPQSLDLRYISFDSIAKMLIMNVSRNTSYIYGDTMLTVISDSDMFTAVLLLIAAWLCAFLIPLIRAALMAVIFYLGFISIIRSLFYSNKVKANIACGQVLTNLIFMLFTVLYFASFKIMMSLTSFDEMLSLDNITATAGSPAWVILAVIILSILYIIGMCWQIKFCFSNHKDMGFEQYSMLASSIVGGVEKGLGKVKDTMSNIFNRDDSDMSKSGSGGANNSLRGTGSRGADGGRSGSNGTVRTEVSAGDTIRTEDVEDILDAAATTDRSDYQFNFRGEEERNGTNPNDIDAIIEAGNSMEDKK